MTSLLAELGSSRRRRQSQLPSSTAGAAFADVLRQTDRGLRPELVAEVLGLPDELVGLALDQAERLGLVVRSCGPSSGRSCPTGPERPVACAGCPLAR